MKIYTFPLGNNPDAKLVCFIQEPLMRGMKLPAAIMCPGGAYVGLAGQGSEQLAMTFVGQGYHGFVLYYSLKLRCAWPQPVVEASMAVKIIRDHAEEWGVNTDEILIAGFSAGGHVASGLGVLWNDPEVQRLAGCSGEENKPNAMLLCFPCINIDMPVFEDNKLYVRAIKNEELVGSHTPPAFVVHSYGDKMVSMEQSTRFVYAMSKHDRPVEFHLYTPGDHGAVCDMTPRDTPDGLTGPWMNDWLPRLKQWLDELWHPKPHDENPPVRTGPFTTREHFETLVCLFWDRNSMGMPTPPELTTQSKLRSVAGNPAAMAVLCEYVPLLRTLEMTEDALDFSIGTWLEYAGYQCGNPMFGVGASPEAEACMARLREAMG